MYDRRPMRRTRSACPASVGLVAARRVAAGELVHQDLTFRIDMHGGRPAHDGLAFPEVPVDEIDDAPVGEGWNDHADDAVDRRRRSSDVVNANDASLNRRSDRSPLLGGTSGPLSSALRLPVIDPSVLRGLAPGAAAGRATGQLNDGAAVLSAIARRKAKRPRWMSAAAEHFADDR